MRANPEVRVDELGAGGADVGSLGQTPGGRLREEGDRLLGQVGGQRAALAGAGGATRNMGNPPSSGVSRAWDRLAALTAPVVARCPSVWVLETVVYQEFLHCDMLGR